MKIVTPAEMIEIEKRAYEGGATAFTLMEAAGKGLALAIEPFLRVGEKISLLCGKGNNGGDGFAAASHLLTKGFHVEALQPESSEDSSPLSKMMRDHFESLGGLVFSSLENFTLSGIILDALFGTGFRGSVAEPYHSIIEAANRSGLPIFAIDIPSGLNGETGQVETVAIQATKTFFLALPKQGFFLREGWNHVGELFQVSLGLTALDVESETTGLSLLTNEEIAAFLPSVIRNRHKYQTGSVAGVAGSSTMPGAALIASTAAFRAGAGMVRLFHPKGMEALLTNAPYELIKAPFDPEELETLLSQINKGRSLFIGPGLAYSSSLDRLIEEVISKSLVPTVIDAEALRLLAEKNFSLPKEAILTPHHGEMQRLFGDEALSPMNEAYLARCQHYAEEKGVTLVLKGSPTFIFSPGKAIHCSCVGDPGMATAGTGDLLTGTIAAFLAQGLEKEKAAYLGVYLHGLAGEIAKKRRGSSYGMMAMDLVACYPEAFFLLSRLKVIKNL